jgi:hypothetical protein
MPSKDQNQIIKLTKKLSHRNQIKINPNPENLIILLNVPDFDTKNSYSKRFSQIEFQIEKRENLIQ